MSATIREKVPLTCQLRKTMQRSVVSQVNSICVCVSLGLELYSFGDNSAAYIHVALVAVIHAGHVVVHVTVVHMRVVHDFVLLPVASVREVLRVAG